MLPRISRVSPVRPRVPITMVAISWLAAKRTISVDGSPSSSNAVASRPASARRWASVVASRLTSSRVSSAAFV